MENRQNQGDNRNQQDSWKQQQQQQQQGTDQSGQQGDRGPQDSRKQQQQGGDRNQQGGMGQPGQSGMGQSGNRQQQQFDSQGMGQQGGGAGTQSRFADQIREHMEVIDADGQHVGTVDALEGDRIKLTKSDSTQHEHRYLPVDQVQGIEGGKIRLNQRGGGSSEYGMDADR
jgi:hypothetical protein